MKIFGRKTRATLEKENEELSKDIAVLKILVKAYIRENGKLHDDIDMLNASLDCTAAELERWKEIAHKADERRVEYVRRMVSRG